MRRIRDQAGKVVVVREPVVIHTGAGEHLARLIREGYVQAPWAHRDRRSRHRAGFVGTRWVWI